jgi:uncharacterized protein (UPF0332 family)
MNKDFEKCLKKKSIVKQPYTEALISDELNAAIRDLKRAKRTFDEFLDDLDYKWATIQAYYSMFHAARALLFAKGYREKSHYCLKIAMQALYADERIIDQSLVDDFDTTMLLRETADYKSDFSKEGAESALENAEEFLRITEELLK